MTTIDVIQWRTAAHLELERAVAGVPLTTTIIEWVKMGRCDSRTLDLLLAGFVQAHGITPPDLIVPTRRTLSELVRWSVAGLFEPISPLHGEDTDARAPSTAH